jgi:hypothetical protein
MPYYETIDEDLVRAKALLAKGRPEVDEQSPTYGMVSGGAIYGADTYAAYKLLESFVEHIAQQRLRFDCGATDTCHIVPGCIRHLAEGNRRLAGALQTVMQVLGPDGVPESVDYGDVHNRDALADEVAAALQAVRSVGIEYQYHRRPKP